MVGVFVINILIKATAANIMSWADIGLFREERRGWKLLVKQLLSQNMNKQAKTQ